jgi:serine/threonine protein kinase
MKKTIRRRTTVNDLRGPSTLRSGLVSKLDGAGGLDDLEPCELIGEGKYGVVHKMMEKTTGQLRVVKTVERPSGWDDQQLKMEAEILQNLDHPHILRIFSWYEDGDAVNIVMEHCEGGELMKVVKEGRSRGQSLPEMWAAACIRQCFEALVYLHTKGIVHKDLKSANILLLQSTERDGKVFATTPHVVICDLGLAEVCGRGIFGTGMGGGRVRRVAGTPVTMAPEVWKGSFGPKSDVWSMGVVMFEMITGRIPFRPEKNEEASWAEAHRKGPDWNLFNGSAAALRLCEALLNIKEASRPTAVEVLEQSWLKQTGPKSLTKDEVDGLVMAVRTWKTRNPTQRALSLKMAAGCTCLKKFATLFSQFDTDSSGILDQGELVEALLSLGMKDNLAKEIAASLDVNNDGSCEYLEFAAACLSSLQEEFDELLRQEFNVLDTSRKGCLTDAQMKPLIDELKPLALAHGLELQDIDANGDGVISFSEFCEYFGRPGVVYDHETLEERRRNNKVTQLPMKQQIRIVKENAVEEFRSAMAASMEMSYLSKTSADAAKSQEMPEVGGKKPKDAVVDRILLRMQQHAKEQDEPLITNVTCDSTRTGPEQASHFSTVSFEVSGSGEGERQISDQSVKKAMERSAESMKKSTESPKELSIRDERSESSFIIGQSHMSQSFTREPGLGCWLTEGPLRWFGIKGPAFSCSPSTSCQTAIRTL